MISIVTVCFNNAEGLASTLNSLRLLACEHEVVVIDGASEDNTFEVVKQYSGIIDQYVSETDDGIYDAMNKGVRLAKGNWIYFLNAGDCIFSNDFFDEFEKNYKKNNIDAVYGDVIYTDGTRVSSTFSKKMYIHNTLHHQSVIYRKELLLSSPFSCKYKILADYDFNLTSYISQRKFIKIPFIVSICESDGISRTSLDEVLNENKIIHNEKYGYILGLLINIIMKIKFRLKNV